MREQNRERIYGAPADLAASTRGTLISDKLHGKRFSDHIQSVHVSYYSMTISVGHVLCVSISFKDSPTTFHIYSLFFG